MTDVADPLMTVVPPDSTWTTVNVSEAMPGVLTPLTWTFWMPAIERGSRASYVDQGIFPKAHATVPDDPAACFQAVFYGRAALNPDLARVLGDLTPGTTGAATEERVLGFARDLPSRSTNRRAPIIAARMPVQVARIGSEVHRLLDETRTWWERSTRTEPATADAAATMLLDARGRFETIIRAHTTATCVGLLFAEVLDRVASRTGIPGAAARATTGYGDLEELQLVRDLVSCAEGALTLDDVVAAHGYHGPSEGQLQARSWRVDRVALAGLVESYRTLDPERRPDALVERQQAARTHAEAELLDAVPAALRPLTRFLLRRAAAALPLREVGKTAFLMALDVGRHAALSAGAHLVSAGLLDDVDEVFLLTVDELTAVARGAAASDLASVLADRRARQRRYASLDLPQVWTGMPEPIEVAPGGERQGEATAGTVLLGAGASAGVVEGVLRVALDLDAAFAAEPDEILACRTTDPSWAAVFPVIAGIVVEVGSATSHAAVVARELGLPCLAGVAGATDVLRSGMRVRLDADAGKLEVLEAQPDLAR